MHRKTLILGMILLLMGSIVSPLTVGVSLQKESTIPLTQFSGLMNSSWPMKCQNNRHTSLSPYNTSHVTGIEKWRTYTNGRIDGGIVIGTDGIIYCGTRFGYIYAVNPNGSVEWTYETNDIIWSTPAIGDDGTIYVGSYNNNLYAIYPDGTTRWSVGLGESITSSPAIAIDGTIYVGTIGDIGSMFAINPNGIIDWRFDTGYYITSDPAIGDDGTIYFGSGDKHVYALNPNGTLKWKYKTGDVVKGPASIGVDGTVYIGSWDGYLYAIFPQNGTVRWKTSIGDGFETNPSIGPNGTIYIGYEKLWAVHPDGSIKWSFSFHEDNEEVWRSSASISKDGIIYVGTNIDEVKGGQVYAINSDGTLRWKKLIANDWIDSTPAIAEDGTVYIGSANKDEVGPNGFLHAFNEVASNSPPNPPLISGPNNVKPGDWNIFRFRTIDPDHNPIHLYIEWSEGTSGSWTGEWASGQGVGFQKRYDWLGTYTIRAKAKDIFGEESDWGYFEVKVPYAYNYTLLQWFQHTFPILSRLLNLLGGLE